VKTRQSIFYAPPASQAGAALIIALVVFSMVAILAVAAGSNFFVTFKRVENQLYGQQAYFYLLSAESLMRSALVEDSGNATDTLLEWAPKEFLFEDQVSTLIVGEVQDLQGRINLNLLSSSSDANQVPKERLIRLIQLMELENPIDAGQAEEIANAVIDWIDDDEFEALTNPGGAESNEYRDGEPSIRAANRAMMSVSEFRLVNGVTDELYKAIRPYLTVYGSGEININTADPLVLRTLNEKGDLNPLDSSDIEQITSLREELADGIESIQDLNEPLRSQVTSNGVVLKSEFFQLSAKTEFVDREFAIYSVLHRDEAARTAKVIARSQSPLESIPTSN